MWSIQKIDDRKFVFVPRGREIAFERRTEDFDQAVEAIRSNRKLKFQYQDYKGREERIVVDPLTLALYEHQFYVIGRPEKQRPRLYRFSRMREVSCLDKTFVFPSPAAYSPEKLFAGSFGVFVRDDTEPRTVTIRLTGDSARYAETHEWHRSQELLPDGDSSSSKLLRLSVRICPELVALIVGLGEDATVVGPRELRDRVFATARAVALKYEHLTGH